MDLVLKVPAECMVIVLKDPLIHYSEWGVKQNTQFYTQIWA